MNYYYHHIGDFKKDTNFLTHELRSIYLEMLWMYYDQERSLEKDIDLLAMKVQATVDQVKLLLTLYFDENDLGYTHKRIEEELQKTYEKSEKARQSAEKRWGLQDKCDRNAKAMLPNTQDPIPKTQVYSKEFLRFWEAYPNKVKKDYSYGFWKKQKLDSMIDKVLKHLENIKQSKEWRDGFVQHPATYLNQKIYLDDVIIVSKIKGRVS